jgi:hypothetical protein
MHAWGMVTPDINDVRPLRRHIRRDDAIGGINRRLIGLDVPEWIVCVAAWRDV